MSKKRIALNYLYSSFYQIFLIVVPLITAPYLARTLLPEAVGVNSYINSVVTIFVTIGLLGLYRYSVREVAYVKNDKEALTKVFYELLIFRILCFIITIIIFILYANTTEYKMLYYINIITILSNFIDISWFYNGLEEFKITVTKNAAIKLLYVVSIFLFIKTPSDLGKLMFIHGLFAFLSNAFLFIGIRKRIAKSNLKNLNIKKHFIPNLKLFLPQIATLLYLQVDKIMIEHLSNNIASVGFYDYAEKIIKVPLALITALSGVMLPRLSNEFKNNKLETVAKYIKTAFKFSLMLAIPLMFGLMATSKTLIPWYLGAGYNGVIPIMMVLSPIVLFISLSSVTGSQYLTATNNTKILTISYVSTAIINLIINYLLIPKLGATGAAIGTLVAEALVFIIQFTAIKNIIKTKDIVSFSIKYFIAGLCMFGTCYYLGLVLSPTTMTTLIQVVIGIIIYFAILFILKDQFFMTYVSKALSMIKEKLKLKRKEEENEKH